MWCLRQAPRAQLALFFAASYLVFRAKPTSLMVYALGFELPLCIDHLCVCVCTCENNMVYLS